MGMTFPYIFTSDPSYFFPSSGSGCRSDTSAKITFSMFSFFLPTFFVFLGCLATSFLFQLFVRILTPIHPHTDHYDFSKDQEQLDDASRCTPYSDADAGDLFTKSCGTSAKLPLDFFCCSGGATMKLDPVTIGTIPLHSLSGPNSQQILLYLSPPWSGSRSATCMRHLQSRLLPHCIYEDGGHR